MLTDLNQLAEKIKSLEHPALDSEKKLQLKSRLFAKIREEEKVVSVIEAAYDFKLDAVKKARIKERVMSMIEDVEQRNFFWSNFFAFNKKLVSGFLLLFLSFGFFSFINVETAVVMAAEFTRLTSFSGQVFVERDGVKVELKEGIELFENDKVLTGKNGQAVIRYFDNSVTRLSGNTEVVVKKLFNDSDDHVSYIEVSLLDGAIWNKVLNLIDSSSSFVVESQSVYAMAHKAAFNVSVDEQSVEVGVFNHTVDLSSGKNKTSVVNGEKIVVSNSAKDISRVAKIPEEEKKQQWVQENLLQDKQYLSDVEAQLIASKAEVVGVDTKDDLSLKNSLREETLLFLTFDDVKKKKIELDLAEKKFIAAQVKLYDADLSSAEKAKAQVAIDGFSAKVEEFYLVIDEVATTDKTYAAELEKYVKHKIMGHKKDLDIVLPNESNYLAKETIDKLELAGAKTEEEATRIKINQAEQKLAAVEEAKGVGEEDTAIKVAQEYKEDIAEVIETIDGSETKEEIAEKVSQDLAILESIDVLPLADVSALKVDVAKATGDLLTVPVTQTPQSEEIEEVIPVPMVEEETNNTVPKPLPPLLQDI